MLPKDKHKLACFGIAWATFRATFFVINRGFSVYLFQLKTNML